ncbi:hypothetical protein ACO22_07386 [Paracoccidioides brasiliensis]|uniref:Uncharacterized protein n=1 Tax=Paracoccidioides brasiliensis TaxID=121759 RepID=A0A1D2J4U4_PARBR|nr:hypothetical protein ACO22_07386 [Paracoccidioides brasiliensis]
MKLGTINVTEGKEFLYDAIQSRTRPNLLSMDLPRSLARSARERLTPIPEEDPSQGSLKNQERKGERKIKITAGELTRYAMLTMEGYIEKSGEKTGGATTEKEPRPRFRNVAPVRIEAGLEAIPFEGRIEYWVRKERQKRNWEQDQMTGVDDDNKRFKHRA